MVVCIGHVFLQLSSSSNHSTSILQDNSSWQTDMRTHLLKSMASGPLKIKKVTGPVLILATHRHTTESVDNWLQGRLTCRELSGTFGLIFYQVYYILRNRKLICNVHLPLLKTTALHRYILPNRPGPFDNYLSRARRQILWSRSWLAGWVSVCMSVCLCGMFVRACTENLVNRFWCKFYCCLYSVIHCLEYVLCNMPSKKFHLVSLSFVHIMGSLLFVYRDR